MAAISAVVDSTEVLTWYAGAMAELEALRLTEDDAPGGIYDNELFTDERGRAVVFLAVAEVPRTGRVAPFDIPAAELAIAVHRGSHADIDVTYGALGAWVADQQLAVSGPVHETYRVGPRDTGEESAWRTEIGWPVFRTTAPTGEDLAG